MRRKYSSVEMQLTAPHLINFLFRVGALYTSLGMELVITSGSEKSAKHKKGSLHYTGRAVDIRIRDYKGRVEVLHHSICGMAATYCMAHGIPENSFDVVLHETHIHIEYDPK